MSEKSYFDYIPQELIILILDKNNLIDIENLLIWKTNYLIFIKNIINEKRLKLKIIRNIIIKHIDNGYNFYINLTRFKKINKSVLIDIMFIKGPPIKFNPDNKYIDYRGHMIIVNSKNYPDVYYALFNLK